jgi:hypothetical protein
VQRVLLQAAPHNHRPINSFSFAQLYVCQGVSEEDLNIHTSKEGAAIRASIQRQMQEDSVAASLWQ